MIAAGAAVYSSNRVATLDVLRGEVGQSGAEIDTIVATLAGQNAQVDERIQALRAITATPELPMTGADLQAQIDRLLALHDEVLALAADDAGASALEAARAVTADAQAALDGLRNSDAVTGMGQLWEMGGVIDQTNFEISRRVAVLESEDAATAAAFDPWSETLDEAHYRAESYDAEAVARNITYSELSAAEKAPLRAALTDAGDEAQALQAALDQVWAALSPAE